MLTAIFLTLIAWFAPLPLALQIIVTVFMGIKFLLDAIGLVGKILKQMDD